MCGISKPRISSQTFRIIGLDPYNLLKPQEDLSISDRSERVEVSLSKLSQVSIIARNDLTWERATGDTPTLRHASNMQILEVP